MTLTLLQKDEIVEMLHRYAGYYSSKNMEMLLASCSPDISGYGSGPDEVVTERTEFKDQIRRDFSQAGAIRISYDIRRVDGTMPVAWAMADCTFEVRVKDVLQTLKGRMTAVLRNTGSRWLFEMVHFSMPYEEQAPGESYPGST